MNAVVAMRHRLEIVSAERIREELDKLITLPWPGAGLWFCVDTGLAEEFLPELPAMKLEQDPIHRHKDVLAHTIAVVENVRPDAKPEFDFRLTRLAALFHDVGKPKTRSFRKGKGVAFHHHEVVGARMTRERMQALRYCNDDVDAVTAPGGAAPALPHLRAWAGPMPPCAASPATRGALLDELIVLTRCDCTTRNERKAAQLAQRMDELEARIAELRRRGGAAGAAARPRRGGRDGPSRHPPGPAVGEALAYLLELRLEEGPLGGRGLRAPRRLVGRPPVDGPPGRRRRRQTPSLRARITSAAGTRTFGCDSGAGSRITSTWKFVRWSAVNRSLVVRAPVPQ